MEKQVIIGVDESGTGAWAGSFATCAVAMTDDVSIQGVKDSKRLSDKKRRALITDIADSALAVSHHLVSVAEMRLLGMKPAWCAGIHRVTHEVTLRVLTMGFTISNIQVVIDGMEDGLRKAELSKSTGIPMRQIRCEPKADDNYVAVSAASIVAKTIRNNDMLRASAQWPEYRWDRNYGYGTSDHDDALKAYGKSPLHRDYKNMNKYAGRG